jgi:hypothetical protein
MLGWLGIILLFVGIIIGSIWLDLGGIGLLAYSLFRRFIKPRAQAQPQQQPGFFSQMAQPQQQPGFFSQMTQPIYKVAPFMSF